MAGARQRYSNKFLLNFCGFAYIAPFTAADFLVISADPPVKRERMEKLLWGTKRYQRYNGKDRKTSRPHARFYRMHYFLLLFSSASSAGFGCFQSCIEFADWV